MIKKLIGLIAGLFGTVGTFLCIVAIIGLWLFKSSLIDSGSQLAAPVESAFNRVDVAMDKSTEVISRAQDKLKYGDPVPVAAAISREISQSKAAVSNAHQTVNNFDQMAGSFDSIAQVVSGERLTNLTTGIAGNLQQLEQAFRRIEGLAADIGTGGTTAVNTLSGELNQLEGKAGTIKAEVAKGRATLATMLRVIPGLVFTGALLLTFLLIWLGFGQFLMMLWGWRKLSS